MLLGMRPSKKMRRDAAVSKMRRATSVSDEFDWLMRSLNRTPRMPAEAVLVLSVVIL
jgi:hypothetical protein